MIQEEQQSGKTIKRDRTILQQIETGSAYGSISQELITSAVSRSYTDPITVDAWQLPAGAFGDSAGPV